MTAHIRIFAEFERNKPLSLVFFAEKEFDNQDYIANFCKKIMEKFQAIYETKILMRCEIVVDIIRFDNEIDLLPE